MMTRLLLLCMLCLVSTGVHAAQWLKLNESSTSILMVDKQSLVTQDAYKKVWVKIEFKRMQSNTESVEKEYNSAKALWYFDCAKQKSATTQVFQYLQQELVYSAGVDVKSAEFTEPLPDSDVEIAMRYACRPEKPPKAATPVEPAPANPPIVTPPANRDKSSVASPASTSGNTEQAPPTTPTSATPKPAANANQTVTPTTKTTTNTKPAAILNGKTTPKKSPSPWSYDDQAGPAQWGKLSPEFQMCEVGRSQSPINIEGTIHAALKPIRAIRKFAANDVTLVNHALQFNFKKGNMMVLDSQPFQLKHMVLRMPSEHTVQGKTFPLEAQWHHEDSKGNLVIVSVLYQLSKKPSATLDKLFAQLPKDQNPVTLSTRITPNDLIPQDNRYYRYSGSLTTPPCSEGVRWVVMKTAQPVSEAQLASLANTMAGHNARPTQHLHGRMVLE